ncbi:MAG: GGDEF domain-containing protein [Bdellovibrionales bacterium]
MKSWVQKLVNQFNFDYEGQHSAKDQPEVTISEDRATLLFILDTYNKHLLEVENHPVRKVRETLDEFAKELLNPERDVEKLLFRFRQFFGSYRIDEYTYVQKTFDDFRGIIWDFVDQLSEDLSQEQSTDREVHHSLKALREAVEANSIDTLKTQSRRFIDFYVEHQTRKDKRRSDRIVNIKKNLDSVRKQLFEANSSMRQDHLTQAFNRKSFDEQLAQYVRLQSFSPEPLTLITLDIDYFKRINDTFGHPIGDFVLKECVRTLHDIYNRSNDFVARIGGEEFAVILPGCAIDAAVAKAEQTLARVQKDVFTHEGHELRFTVSMGIAQLQSGESADKWLKRADDALYKSKNTGRNRYTVSVPQTETHAA